MTAKPATNWVEVFTKTRAILGSGDTYIYHGQIEDYSPENTGKRCRCIWTATLNGYEEVTGENPLMSDEGTVLADKLHIVNVLRMAVGLEPQEDPDAQPVYNWNDEHTDEEVLAAADRAIALVS